MAGFVDRIPIFKVLEHIWVTSRKVLFRTSLRRQNYRLIRWMDKERETEFGNLEWSNHTIPLTSGERNSLLSFNLKYVRPNSFKGYLLPQMYLSLVTEVTNDRTLVGSDGNGWSELDCLGLTQPVTNMTEQNSLFQEGRLKLISLGGPNIMYVHTYWILCRLGYYVQCIKGQLTYQTIQSRPNWKRGEKPV